MTVVIEATLPQAMTSVIEKPYPVTARSSAHGGLARRHDFRLQRTP
jgi:hypothetical protein